MATSAPDIERNDAEALQPSPTDYYVVFGSEDDETRMTLVQRPLSFFGKIELFGLLGETMDKALKDGLSISELLETPERDSDSPLRVDDFKEADAFVKGVAKLVKFAPELLSDIYMIILNVPRGERFYVKQVMERPEHLGGLSDDQGIKIIEVFVAQNYESIKSFFVDKILPLLSKTLDRGSESSKPSKPTRQRTQKG